MPKDKVVARLSQPGEKSWHVGIRWPPVGGNSYGWVSMSVLIMNGCQNLHSECALLSLGMSIVGIIAAYASYLVTLHSMQ